MLVGKLRNQGQFNFLNLQILVAFAIALHALTAYGLIYSATGMDLSLTSVLALLAPVINTLVWFSTFNKPLQSLYLGLSLSLC